MAGDEGGFNPVSQLRHSPCQPSARRDVLHHPFRLLQLFRVFSFHRCAAQWVDIILCLVVFLFKRRSCEQLVLVLFNFASFAIFAVLVLVRGSLFNATKLVILSPVVVNAAQVNTSSCQLEDWFSERSLNQGCIPRTQNSAAVQRFSFQSLAYLRLPHCA